EHLLMHRCIEDRAQNLDAAVEIARHHVGRRDIDRGLPVRKAETDAKAIDAAVFEEAADDRLHPDALGKTRHTRAQAANTANDEINLHARTRRVIERVDDAWVDQRVYFHPDRGRPAGFGVRGLVSDVIEDALLQIDRRDREPFQLGRLGITGDEIEDPRDVARDYRIGREERQVSVDARR